MFIAHSSARHQAYGQPGVDGNYQCGDFVLDKPMSAPRRTFLNISVPGVITFQASSRIDVTEENQQSISHRISVNQRHRLIF